MTVSAHHERHVYAGATRIGHMQNADTPPANLFLELCPHLRDVPAAAQTTEEILHGYLLRRGPRSLSQLAVKVGSKKYNVKKCMEERPGMFRREGRLWAAIPQEKKPMTERQRMDATLAAQIESYLLEHGPSTVREITDGIGHPNIHCVSAIIAKPPCNARRIGKKKKGYHLWGVE